MVFEANHGQAGRKPAFVLRAGDWTLHLDRRGTTLTLADGGLVRMRFRGARTPAQLEAGATLPGYVSYLGPDLGSRLAAIPTHDEVWYRDLPSSIAARFYVNAGRVEYDLVVPPGGDLGDLAFAFDGVDRLGVDADGALALQVGAHALHMAAPVVYQDDAGRRRSVAGVWQVRGRHAAIALGGYDRTRPVIADPVFAFATYLGGSGYEYASSVAVGADDAIYVAGTTASADFPRLPADATHPTGTFVSKLDATASTLLYSVILPANPSIAGIAVDAGGQVVLAGTAGPGFPTVNAAQSTPAGGSDAIVAKLNASGTGLVYSTYLGGSGDDTARGLALDASGAAYVVGATAADIDSGVADFPTLNAVQPVSGGESDGFAAAFEPDGALRWSTFIGGERADSCHDVAVTAAGDVFVSGVSASWTFPTTPGAHQSALVSGALARSFDDGASWAVGGPPTPYIGAIALDSAQPTTILTGSTGFDGDTSAASIFRSADDGATWERVYVGPPWQPGTSRSPAIRRLLSDPATPGRWFALVFTEGVAGGSTVVRSIDGGLSWSPAAVGLPAVELLDLALDPTTAGTLYAVAAVDAGARLYRTIDGGDHWSALPTALPVSLIVVDPSDGQHVLVAAGADVYQSTDGGLTFDDASTGLPRCDVYCPEVTALAIDPSDGRRWYAGGRGAFRTTNRGVSWERTCVPGPVQRIAVDPADPRRVFGASLDGRFGAIFVSKDGGTDWTVMRQGRGLLAFALVPGTPQGLLAGINAAAGQSFLTRFAADGTRGFSTFTSSGPDLAGDPAGNAVLPAERVTPSGTVTPLAVAGFPEARGRVVSADGRVHVPGSCAVGGLVADWNPDDPNGYARPLNLPFTVLAIALPSDGGTVVAGGVYGATSPDTTHAAQPTSGGGVDAYVAEVAPGSGDPYSTCYPPTTTTSTLPPYWFIYHCDPPVGPTTSTITPTTIAPTTTTPTTTAPTTTTLSQHCTDDRTCTDRDRCTRDLRCDGICVHAATTGLELAACTSRDLIADAACSADEIAPITRTRAIHATRRAMRLIRAAIGATTAVRARRLDRADCQLGQLSASLHLAADRGQIAPACGARLDEALATLRLSLH